MKIVHVCETLATGVLRVVAGIINAQSLAGHEVTLVYSIRPTLPALDRALFNHNIRLIALDMVSVSGRVSAVPRLITLFHRLGPDAVVLHSSFAGFLGRLAGLFTRSGARFFYIPHCISLGRQDVGVLSKSAFIALEWIACLKNSAYIACSVSEKTLIKRWIPFRACHLIENTDFGDNDTQINAHESTSVVVTAGEIRSQKAPGAFAAIAREVRAERPEIEFLWLGDGDAHWRKELEGAGVRVSGWVDRTVIRRQLESSSVYLSTATWEGMSVALIEAMRAGLAIVASRCPGNESLIRDGETGLLFDSADEARTHILSLVQSEAASVRLGQRAREEAQTRFSSDRYMSQLNALLEGA